MHKHTRHSFLLAVSCLAAGMLLPSGKAEAAYCAWINGQGTTTHKFTLPATLTIPRDAKVGTVIKDVSMLALPSSTLYAFCDSGSLTYAYRTVSGGAQVAGLPDYVFATNVPGIGMRFYDLPVGWPKRYWGPGKMQGVYGNWGWNNSWVGAEVVVTGPVSPGVVDGSLLATFKLGTDSSTITVTNMSTTTTTIVAQSCTVTNTALAVDMPTVVTTSLPAVGATSSAKGFSIGVSCPSTSSGAKVFMTLTDAANPGNTGNTLTLAPDATASGVRPQILNAANTPISFGPDSANFGTTNQWLVGNSTGTNISIPLSVRYIRTGPINPGTVKAAATFTMSYQ